MFGHRTNVWRVTPSLFVGLLFLMPVQSAMGQSAPEFKLSAPSRLNVGQPLIISIEVSQRLKSLNASLLRSKGLVELGHKRWTAVTAHRSYKLKYSLSAGKHELKLVLSAITANGPSKIEFPLEVRVIAPMRVEISKDGLDANQGRLSIFAHTALAQAKVEIFDKTGGLTERKVIEFSAANQIGSIELMFEPIKPERVFRLELSLEDGAGQWKRFKFVRWFAEIPHDDVVFESGRWEILPEESQKLDAAITILRQEVEAFRASVGRADVDFDVSLYVGGMTDTVGTKADNQRLSLKRARSIAAYFRRKRLALPIYVAGFGEAGLRLPTADEVPEAQNRRAIYVLTSGTHPNLTPPSGQWQKY